ncbi:MAG TPA: hypothetical protein VFR47_10200 [Anaerolineales bacterium]|nr:hypothetical protein [Anaerolineales bacterium]
MSLKIAFAGTGGINKVHARAAQSLGLELVAAYESSSTGKVVEIK